VAVPAPEIKTKEDPVLPKNYKDTDKSGAFPQKNVKDIDKSNAVIWIALSGERTAPRGGGAFLFKGQMELKSLASTSSTAYSLVKSLKDIFSRTLNVHYRGESCSEKECTTQYEIKEPLPLVDILKNVPLVKEVVVRDDGLKLVL
jgi:hypothetical protein